MSSLTLTFSDEELKVIEQAVDEFQKNLCRELKLSRKVKYAGDISDSEKVRLSEVILNKVEASFDYYMDKNLCLDCVQI